mgnify:CR=1 FL=1
MPHETTAQFTLGPVQSFIVQARSVRDLWTGSYLLSWLAARAAATALDDGAAIDDPQWADSPLVRLHRAGGVKPAREDARALSSGLPNTFLFHPKAAEVQATCDKMRKAVEDEWKNLCNDVHRALCGTGKLGAGWDAGWDGQVDAYWTIRVDWLEHSPGLREIAMKLGAKASELPADDALLPGAVILRAAGAAKLLRPLRPHGDPADTRPKCSLSGTEAQMGPRDFDDATKFWKGAEAPMAAAVQQCGERLRDGERLGAPALVKRLAWTCSIAKRLGRETQELRTTDSATIAAAPWIASLRSAAPALPDEHHYLHEWARETHGAWSGRWIHNVDDQDEPAPRNVAAMIREAKSREGLLAPQAYLAVLVMDGDKMGERLGRCSANERRDFTTKLARFAGTQVPALIRDYLGGEDGLDLNQPVYAGGDDVLALLPMWMPGRERQPRSVLDLARSITAAFGALGLPGGDKPATMSAGIALVHHKADLREVLKAARDAEKAAKGAGRDRLCLAVVRRSGEHASAGLPWKHTKVLDDLVGQFLDGASDRWAYRLRQTLDGLAESIDPKKPLPNDTFVDLIDREAARLIAHGSGERATKDAFCAAWDTLTGRLDDKGATVPGRTHTQQREALTLIQSASFMARGREEAR